jgi:TetR/AcrR family transcriptional regulator, mexJK operon transcriptional repressor
VPVACDRNPAGKALAELGVFRRTVPYGTNYIGLQVERVNGELYGTVMTPAQPRPASDERREMILRIAYEGFLKNGYAATSMSSIANQVGGSKATLYSYFASKEELFAAVVGEKCEDTLARMFETEEMCGDFPAALSRLAERIARQVMTEDNIATYRLITAEAGRFPELGCAFYRSGPKRGREILGGMFARAIAEGHLRNGDSGEMAQLFFDLCKGDLRDRKLWQVTPNPSDEEIAATVSRAVFVFLSAYGTHAQKV